MLPRNRMATSVFVKVRVARKSSVLKLGYLTLLTIIHDKNTSSTGRKKRHLPVANSFSSHQIMNSVSEATRPAAEGIGKPRNSFECSPRMAVRQLNRARRNAPQSR